MHTYRVLAAKTITALLVAVLLCLLSVTAHAQPQQLQYTAPAPPAPVPGTLVVGSQTGGQTIYYFVAARYPAGIVVSNATPAFNTVGIPNLSVSNYVTVSWAAVAGATGYDVVRSTTPTFPAACSACAVITNTPSLSVNDQGGGSSYSPGSNIPTATATLSLNTTSAAAPYTVYTLNATDFALLPFTGAYVNGHCVVISVLSNNMVALADSGSAACNTGGAGTVTSVGLTVPNWLTVAGSPVTAAGTLAVTAAGAQTPHLVIGTCNAATSFGPCALVAADLPLIPISTGISGLGTGVATALGLAVSGTGAICLTSGSLCGGGGGGSLIWQAGGTTFSTNPTTVNFASGFIGTNPGGLATLNPDPATITLVDNVLKNACLFVDSNTGNTSYSGSLACKALTTADLVPGSTFLLRSNFGCTGACTVQINGVPNVAASIKQADGTTDPNGAIIAGEFNWIMYDGAVFRLLPGGVGGGITIQTNSVNNASQTALNFINSTVNAVGLTVTASNPGTSQEKFEIGGTYSAALANGVTATTQATGDATTKVATDQFVSTATTGTAWATQGFNGANKTAIANTLICGGVTLPPGTISTGHLVVGVVVADGANNSDVGIYDASGNLEANIGAQLLSATGPQSFAIAGGTKTLKSGKSYVCFTSVGATLALTGSNNNTSFFFWGSTAIATVGGALPATITPPADNLSVGADEPTIMFLP